ncbi:MAG: GAF domain-containing protein [Gammaproteobacteria bacterium]|nr:GAF domain-containing protein [Gammaproteobacteria bacterium]
MTPTLDTIRNCLDGAIPATIATCAPDGTPNVAYLSHVHYIDNQHVALSFQFFSKTRENVLANPYATVQVVDPDTAAHYHLALHYLRTEAEGPLFENMKAKLAGIASHTGMSKVFKLRGSDVYEVLTIEKVPGATLPPPLRRNHLAALRAASQRIARCADLSSLLDEALLTLEQQFGIHHMMLLFLNESGDRLYTVASRGYERSGIGSEIRFGEGILGVAARERTPIRITHMANEYLYCQAARHGVAPGDLEKEIPLPGIPQSRSQLAVPVQLHGQLRGVLYVESPQDQRFSYEDEDALVTIADHLALMMQLCGQAAESDGASTAAAQPDIVSGKTAIIRHYAADDSVFIGGDYLIKGVAGAILWKLLHEHSQQGRTEFTNRELRLDPTLHLPDIGENLEARLILLQKRLTERCPFLRLEKTGRGRFRLRITQPVQLAEAT